MPSASRESGHVALSIEGKATVEQDRTASEFPMGTCSMMSRCWEGARSLAWPFDQWSVKSSGVAERRNLSIVFQQIVKLS